jgi:hypothetical protein
VDAVPDAIGLEREQRLPNLVGRACLAGVDGETQPGSATLAEEVGVVGEAEAIGVRARDIDAHDPAAAPGDRLRRDDLVHRRREAAVEAEDQPGANLRILEHGAVHPRTAAAMM